MTGAAATELWRMSATELAEAIRARQASSAEVVEAHLRRIEAVTPAINAVVLVLGEQALQAAQAADRALAAAADPAPFHGVPFTIKDIIDVAGLRTPCWSCSALPASGRGGSSSWLPSRRFGRGRIINVCGGVGLPAIPMLSAYVASKTALYRLSENLAAETRGHGVMVFAIDPGLVRTAISAAVCPAAEDVAQMAARAADIEERNLYVLRERK